jgi:hypothetical protein
MLKSIRSGFWCITQLWTNLKCVDVSQCWLVIRNGTLNNQWFSGCFLKDFVSYFDVFMSSGCKKFSLNKDINEILSKLADWEIFGFDVPLKN